MEPMEEMALWSIFWKSASQGYYLVDGRDHEYKDSGTEAGQCEVHSVESEDPGETAVAPSRITVLGWGEESAEGGPSPAGFSGAEGWKVSKH